MPNRRVRMSMAGLVAALSVVSAGCSSGAGPGAAPTGPFAVYVGTLDGTVTPFLTSAKTPLLPIQLSGADAIAFAPNGKTAYVVSTSAGTLTPVRVHSRAAGKPIKVGSTPSAVVITPDGKKAYIANN